MVIVQQLKPKLPKGYVAGPRVHIGAQSEVDVAALERDPDSESDPLNAPDGGIATAVWAPAVPSLLVESAIPEEDEYEVRVYDVRRGRRLVASIEIVSPGNKDWPDNRLAFVAKCADLMRKGIAVSIVDLVTVRNFNLYVELLSLFGQVDPRQIDPKQATRHRQLMPAHVDGRPESRNRFSRCGLSHLWSASPCPHCRSGCLPRSRFRWI